MSDIDTFVASVNKAYDKPAGENWPGSGRKLAGVYIDIAGRNQLRLLQKAQKKFSKKDIAGAFWSATQLRYVLTGEFIVGLKVSEKKTHAPPITEITSQTQFLLDVLKEKSTEDPFCVESNTYVSDKDMQKIYATQASASDMVSAKRLSLALTSAAWACGYDTYFPNFMDMHGPYTLANNNVLVVRDFKFDTVPLVWPEIVGLPKRLRFYLEYAPVPLTIDWELHLESTEELTLRAAHVVVVENEKEIPLSQAAMQKMTLEVAAIVSQQVAHVNALSIVDKVHKAADLVYLQTKGLADLLMEDWRPPAEVRECITKYAEEKWNALSVAQAVSQTPSVPAAPSPWSTTFDPRVARK